MTAPWTSEYEERRGPYPPSRVRLEGWLTDTMGKSELEQAAMLLVRACAVLGDRWRPLTLVQVNEVWRLDFLNKVYPFSGLVLNPFFRPDFLGLVAHGFARFEGEGPPDDGHAFELTTTGIEALERWVWPRFTAMHAAAAQARGDLVLRRMDSWGLAVLDLAVDLTRLGAVWTDEDLEPVPHAELGVASHG